MSSAEAQEGYRRSVGLFRWSPAGGHWRVMFMGPSDTGLDDIYMTEFVLDVALLSNEVAVGARSIDFFFPCFLLWHHQKIPPTAAARTIRTMTQPAAMPPGCTVDASVGKKGCRKHFQNWFCFTAQGTEIEKMNSG